MDTYKIPEFRETLVPTLNKKILLVEDEAEIRQLISLHLRREGYEVVEATDGDHGRKLAQTERFDLMILDWMLPGASGLELTRMVRADRSRERIPILFVTARSEPDDIISGLEAGADDYIPKPFDNQILMARVKALLRRVEWLRQSLGHSSPIRTVGPLALNVETYEVTLDGQPMDLTRSEFRLLESLIQNQGRVLSRDHLIAEIQGEGVNVVGRTVDTHVFGLRKKLGTFADMIETIRGVGYRVRYL